MNILASTPPSLTSHLGLTIFIAVAAVGTAAVIGAGMTLDSRPAVKVAVIGTCGGAGRERRNQAEYKRQNGDLHHFGLTEYVSH